MEKEIINKMARYVELSSKFTKSEGDIFTEEELKTLHLNNGHMTGICSGTLSFGVASHAEGIGTVASGNISLGQMTDYISLNGTVEINGKEIYVDDDGNVKAKDKKKPLTRGEQLELNTMVEIKARAVLLDEYDEYNKLRTSLNGYFKGVDDLINE